MKWTVGYELWQIIPTENDIFCGHFPTEREAQEFAEGLGSDPDYPYGGYYYTIRQVLASEFK